MRSITCIIGMGTTRITLLTTWCCSIPYAIGKSTPREEDELPRRVLRGALVLLERSAGKLARSVLRGPGSSNAPRLPDGALQHFELVSVDSNVRVGTANVHAARSAVLALRQVE